MSLRRAVAAALSPALAAGLLACGSGAPSAPENLRIRGASVDGIELAWDLPAEDVESPVSVVERNVGGTQGFLPYIATESSTATDTQVVRGANYQYRVVLVARHPLSEIQDLIERGERPPKDDTSDPSNVELAGL